MSSVWNIINVRDGLLITFLSMFMFQGLNTFISYLGPPKKLKDSKDEFWKYKNVLISWIHACIVGPWTLACALFIREYWIDSILHVDSYGYMLLAVSTGYFLYDCLDCIINGKVFKMWEVCLHHVVVISIFVYNLVQIKFVGYTIFALLVEVNSIFLHARKLMQMSKVDFNHWFYRFNNSVNLATFVIFRFGGLVIITYGMVTPYELRRIFSTEGSLSYYILLAVGMFTMWIINPVLFWRLLKNDYLRKNHSGKLKHGHKNGLEMNGVNNNAEKLA